MLFIVLNPLKCALSRIKRPLRSQVKVARTEQTAMLETNQHVPSETSESVLKSFDLFCWNVISSNEVTQQKSNLHCFMFITYMQFPGERLLHATVAVLSAESAVFCSHAVSQRADLPFHHSLSSEKTMERREDK